MIDEILGMETESTEPNRVSKDQITVAAGIDAQKMKRQMTIVGRLSRLSSG